MATGATRRTRLLRITDFMPEKPIPSNPPAAEMVGSESDRNTFDEALFAAAFNDLPAVKALRRSFTIRRVSDDDPARVLLEVCGKFDERLTALANRQLASSATFHDGVEKFRDAIYQGATQWDLTVERMARLEKCCEALEQQLAVMIKTMGQTMPALDQANADLTRTAQFIEGRTLSAFLIRYFVPFLTFGVGVAVALWLRRG